MRRPFVISSFGLALALVPAVLFAQRRPPRHPPVSTARPARRPGARAQPAAPKLAFTSPGRRVAGPDQAGPDGGVRGVRREAESGSREDEDATLKQQAAGFKIYKSAEPSGRTRSTSS